MGVSGTRSSNSEPRRGPLMSDRTHTRSPPTRRDSPLATIRPSPRPSFCLVRESSPRENALNRYGLNAAGMPIPVSVTLTTTNRDRGLRLALRVIDPCSVNLSALRNSTDTSLAKSRSSMRISSGTDGSTDHSTSLVEACPLELRLRTSIRSPNDVSVAMAESGRPPKSSDSFTTTWRISLTRVSFGPGVDGDRPADSPSRLPCSPSMCKVFSVGSKLSLITFLRAVECGLKGLEVSSSMRCLGLGIE